MPKRTIYTKLTPLPVQVTRDIVIEMLQDHDLMIELNPLVIEHHPCQPPSHAEAEEFAKCKWQLLTDRVSYMPGGMVTGKVSYYASFFNLHNGLQTHVYAPLGLDIRGKWSVGGNMPGEPREPEELGLNVPREGLYLREDVDMKCNMLMTGFVKKNLEKAHSVLVARLMAKSEFVEGIIHSQSRSGLTSPNTGARTFSSASSHQGSSPSMDQTEWRKNSIINVHPPGPSNEIHELAPPTPAGPVELHSEPSFAVSRTNTIGYNNEPISAVSRSNTIGYNDEPGRDFARSGTFPYNSDQVGNFGRTNSIPMNSADFYNTGPSNPSSARSQVFSDGGNSHLGFVSPTTPASQRFDNQNNNNLAVGNTGNYSRYSGGSEYGNLRPVSPDNQQRYSQSDHGGLEVNASSAGDSQKFYNSRDNNAGPSNAGDTTDSRYSYTSDTTLPVGNSGQSNPVQNSSTYNETTSNNPALDKYQSQRVANPFVRKG